MPYELVADRSVVVGSVPGSGVVQRARNVSGALVEEGAVVVLDVTTANADQYLSFNTTTTADDPNVFGVLLDGPVANGRMGRVLRTGFADKVLVDGTVDIAKNDLLSTHTVAGISAKATFASGAYAVAMEAYSADDSNGKIKAMLLGDMAIRQGLGAQKLWAGGMLTAMGEISAVDNATATTITTQSTYTAVNGFTTTLFGSPDYFDMPSNGRLRYTGVSDIVAHFGCTLSWTVAGNNVVIKAVPYKNGTVNGNNEFDGGTAITSGTVERKIGTGGDIGSTAIHAFIALSQNDYIELGVLNDSGTQDVTIKHYNIFAMEMP